MGPATLSPDQVVKAMRTEVQDEAFPDYILPEPLPGPAGDLPEARKRVYFKRSVHDRRLHSLRFAVDPGTETLTQQQFKEETDINTIVRRFGLTHTLPAAVAEGMYGDFTGITDYESAAAMIDQAHAAFMQLPAAVRDRFGNDVGKLVQYVESQGDDAFAQRELEGMVPPPVAPPASVASPDAV